MKEIKYIVEDMGTRMFFCDTDEEWTKDINEATLLTEHEKDILLGNIEPMGHACLVHFAGRK